MVYFHSVVLMITNKCNLHCRHCYPQSGSSPKEIYQYGNHPVMSIDQVRSYVCQISRLEGVGQGVHFAGGEPTLFREELTEMIRVVKEAGMQASLVTNCSWAGDQRKADAMARSLKRAGLMKMDLSVSRFHQQQLDISFVIRAIRSCKKNRIAVIIRPTILRSVSIGDTIKGIPFKDLQGTRIFSSYCSPVGRAEEWLVRKEFLEAPIEHQGCETFLNLAIRQNGRVYPCCAGSDITENLSLGNANQKPLFEIIERARVDPLLNILFRFGPKYLRELFIAKKGYDIVKKQPVTICDLCVQLFKDTSKAGSLRQCLLRHLNQKLQVLEVDH